MKPTDNRVLGVPLKRPVRIKPLPAYPPCAWIDCRSQRHDPQVGGYIDGSCGRTCREGLIAACVHCVTSDGAPQLLAQNHRKRWRNDSMPRLNLRGVPEYTVGECETCGRRFNTEPRNPALPSITRWDYLFSAGWDRIGIDNSGWHPPMVLPWGVGEHIITSMPTDREGLVKRAEVGCVFIRYRAHRYPDGMLENDGEWISITDALSGLLPKGAR